MPPLTPTTHHCRERVSSWREVMDQGQLTPSHVSPVSHVRRLEVSYQKYSVYSGEDVGPAPGVRSLQSYLLIADSERVLPSRFCFIVRSKTRTSINSPWPVIAGLGLSVGLWGGGDWDQFISKTRIRIGVTTLFAQTLFYCFSLLHQDCSFQLTSWVIFIWNVNISVLLCVSIFTPVSK